MKRARHLFAITLLLAAGTTLAGPLDTGPINGPGPIGQPAAPIFDSGPSMIESRLGFMIGLPLLTYDNTGVLTYSAAAGALSVDATPLALRVTAGAPPLLIAPGAGGRMLTIDIQVAADGSLVGGAPGDDLLITGDVNLNGNMLSGVLLTGEVTEYMGMDSGGPTDFHSFRFDVTGGLLSDLFGGDIGIELTSESSNFVGDYTVDFEGEAKGNVGPVECTGTLGDFVWLDLDGNGIQDAGEPGIADVQLVLTDEDGNTTTTTTDGTGFYQFGDLCGGTYVVSVNPATLPPAVAPTVINAPGSDPTNDSNDPNGTTVTLPDNSGSDQDTDFGYVQLTSALGDYVWEDLNMDGVQDANEPGVPGVTVNLYDCVGNLLDTMMTDANGFYLFDNLASGCYVVEFERPSGYVFTLMDQTGDAIDSDADPTTGFTGPVNLGPGETNLDVDAGIFVPPSAELGDRYWEDLNANGIQDPGEPGIPGVTVSLLDCAGNVLGTTVTDSNGMYLFTDLPAGCYVVEFMTPAGCIPTAQDVGGMDALDSDADPVTGQTGQITLADMQSDLTWDAGCYYLAGLGDFVWNDLNQDGVQDPGEPGIPGLLVTLLDANMNPTGMTTFTGSGGEYQFTGLMPGSYFVQFTAPAGFVYTLQNVGADDTDSDANSTGKSDKVDLESGEFDPTIDAGVYVPDDPSIMIEKATNGIDADDPNAGDAPQLVPGDTVTWTYLVTNTGNVTLDPVNVTDDAGTPGDPTDDLSTGNGGISCPFTLLGPGDFMECTATGTVMDLNDPTVPSVPGVCDGEENRPLYENYAVASGIAPDGSEQTDDDPSHYCVPPPGVNCMVLIDEDGIDNGFYNIENAAPACGLPSRSDNDYLVNDSDWLGMFGYSVYDPLLFPDDLLDECQANGLPYERKLPTECGNPTFLWNLFVRDRGDTYPGCEGPWLLPTGQVDDEGYFALPEKGPTGGIMYDDNRPAYCDVYVYGANGIDGWDLFVDDFRRGVVPQQCLDKVRDVVPLRNHELIELVGKTCTAIVYDSDINMDYINQYANLQGERYGSFTFRVEMVELPALGAAIPESTSDTDLYNLWLRVLPPEVPGTPFAAKVHDHEPDSIAVTYADYDDANDRLTVYAVSNYAGVDNTAPYYPLDVHPTVFGAPLASPLIKPAGSADLWLPAPDTGLPVPDYPGDDYAFMTLSVDGADYAGDLGVDPFIVEAQMTYIGGNQYEFVLDNVGVDLDGRSLLISTDEGGSYSVIIGPMRGFDPRNGRVPSPGPLRPAN